jgi:hypothetical protein
MSHAMDALVKDENDTKSPGTNPPGTQPPEGVTCATTAQPTSSAPQDGTGPYRWIRCGGCHGEIGIPPDWKERSVECPKCETWVQVKANGQVVYRPPGEAAQRPSHSGPSTAPAAAPGSPSLDLIRQADKAMISGILSIILGWTFIVPFFGVCMYYETAKLAKEESVLVPGKATVGLVLSLLFGIAQGIVLIAKTTH